MKTKWFFVMMAFLAVFSTMVVVAEASQTVSVVDKSSTGVVSSSYTYQFPTFEEAREFLLGRGLSDQAIDQIAQEVGELDEPEPEAGRLDSETLAFESVYDAKETLLERGVTEIEFAEIVAKVEESHRKEQGAQNLTEQKPQLGYFNNDIYAYCPNGARADVWHTGGGQRWFTDRANNQVGSGGYSCSAGFCISGYTYYSSGYYNEHIMNPSSGTYGHTYTGCN